MATRCFKPIRGKRLRVTELDSCGALPASGAECATVTTDGFISLSLSAEVEEGTEIITRKADGSLCINERTSDSFKRFTLEAEFCGVDPDLMSKVSNAEVYLDYSGDSIGIVVAEGAIEKWFALELWTGLSGQACASGAEEASGYGLLPFMVAGVPADITIDGENAISFGITGSFSKGGNQWGEGPYNVIMDETSTAAPLPTALDPLDHLLLIMTDVAPPPSACGCAPFLPVA